MKYAILENNFKFKIILIMYRWSIPLSRMKRKKNPTQKTQTNKLKTKQNPPHTTTHYIFTVVLTILINLSDRKPKVAQVKRSVRQ